MKLSISDRSGPLCGPFTQNSQSGYRRNLIKDFNDVNIGNYDRCAYIGHRFSHEVAQQSKEGI